MFANSIDTIHNDLYAKAQRKHANHQSPHAENLKDIRSENLARIFCTKEKTTNQEVQQPRQPKIPVPLLHLFSGLFILKRSIFGLAFVVGQEEELEVVVMNLYVALHLPYPSPNSSYEGARSFSRSSTRSMMTCCGESKFMASAWTGRGLWLEWV